MISKPVYFNGILANTDNFFATNTQGRLYHSRNCIVLTIADYDHNDEDNGGGARKLMQEYLFDIGLAPDSSNGYDLVVVVSGRYTLTIDVEVKPQYALQRLQLISIGKTELRIRTTARVAICLHGGFVGKIDRQFSFLRFVEL